MDKPNNMRDSWSGKGLLLFLLLALWGSGLAIPPADADTSPELLARSYGSPVAWACWTAEAPLVIGTAGKVDDTFGYQVNDSTVFWAASLGKPIIAMACLKLAEEGKLDLDAPVNDYLPPRFQPRNPYAELQALTVAHLLEHSSGLDETRFSEYFVAPEGELAWREALEHSGALECRWYPGRAASYSNPNYVLLALIIEQVSGQLWWAYVDQQIFQPLEMTHSCFGCSDEQIEADSWNFIHTQSEHQNQGVAPPEHYRYVPAYGFRTSIRDYARFMQCLLQQGTPILQTSSWERMTRIETTDASQLGLQIGYTAGLRRDQFQRIPRLYFTASIEFYTARMEIFPSLRGGWVALFHQSPDPSTAQSPLAEALRQQIFPSDHDQKKLSEIEAPSNAPFDPQFSGCYRFDNPRNSILGWRDKYFNWMEVKPAEGDVVMVENTPLVQRKASLLSPLFESGPILAYGKDREGLPYMQLGEAHYSKCDCRVAKAPTYLYQVAIGMTVLLFCLSLAMYFIKRETRNYGGWSIAILATPLWSAALAYEFLVNMSIPSLSGYSLKTFFLLLLCSWPILITAWGIWKQIQALRKRKPLWIQLGMLMLQAINGLLVAALFSEELAFFASWRW